MPSRIWDEVTGTGVTDVLSFSKTPAAAAPYLTQIGSGSIRADKKTGEPVTEAAP